MISRSRFIRRYSAQYLTIVWRIRRVDRANIVRNSNGAFKQQPCPAATRRLRQQLPRQRYLTYNICLNHDVVRLHKPVPEPEHGALYSSQAATMDGCVRARRSPRIFANMRAYTAHRRSGKIVNRPSSIYKMPAEFGGILLEFGEFWYLFCSIYLSTGVRNRWFRFCTIWYQLESMMGLLAKMRMCDLRKRTRNVSWEFVIKFRY